MKKIALVFFISLFCMSYSYAEYIYLNSGEVIQGKIISQTNSAVSVKVGTKIRKISVLDIASVSKTKQNVATVVADTATVTSNASSAKTQFTSNSQDMLDNGGQTYVSENHSSAIIYNVKEVDMPVQQSTPQPTATSQSAGSDDLSAALAGGDSQPAPAPVQNDQPSSPAPQPVQSQTVQPAPQSSGSDDLSAALAGGDSQPAPVPAQNDQPSSPAPQPVQSPVQPVPQSSGSDDLAAALAGGDSQPVPAQNEQSSTQVSAPQSQSEPAAPAPAKDDDYDAAAYLLGDASSVPQAPAAQDSQDKAPANKDNTAAKKNNEIKYENFVGISLDLKGSHNTSGMGIPSQNTDYGVSVAIERYEYFYDFLAVGLGASYQFNRHLEQTPGSFSFLPIYASVKLKALDRDMWTLYGVGQLGYSFMFGNEEYLGDAKARGGLYYAIGAGASYHNVVLQLLYSVSSGRLAGAPGISENVSFGKAGIYLGYLF